MSEKTPQIRFKGFTDDWEERKLNEVAIFYNGLRIPIDSSLRKQGEYPYYGATGIIDYVEDYIFDGEFVLLAEDGANITMRNSPIAYLTQGKFWLNNHAHIMAMKDGSNDFLVQLLEKQNYEKYNSGTAQPKLNSQVVKSLNFLFPTKEEQKKIGSFFKQLDDTIALHQRKLDLLKEQKKGFLQKMFPKNGAKVPELRFAGFADDWEERKSKDIFKPKIRKGEPDLPVLSVTQTSGVVYRDEVGIDIKYDISTLKNYKVIEPNDFVISLRSFQGGFELSDKLGITSPAYTIFVPKSPEEQNNLFWRIQFKRFQFIQTLKTVTFGIRDGKSISFNEFGDLKIKFPSNILEQQKIGAFFKELDNTIALHQRKLDLLKEQKKGFLQKMFVS